jgi:hypothetical protein
MKAENIDIALNQEVKAPSIEIGKTWTAFWDLTGKSIIGSSGSAAGGTAIFFSPNIMKEIENLEMGTSDDGRVSFATFNWENSKYSVLSVYAPAAPIERKKFFDSQPFQFVLENSEPDTQFIFGGDWNCYQNPKLEKKGGNRIIESAGHSNLILSLADFEVEDWWRRRFPEELQFTWEANTVQGKVFSRLDRIYTSISLNSKIESITSETNTFSDHKHLIISIALPQETKRGKGSWVFNSSLLHLKDFTSHIKLLLKSFDPTLNNMETLIAWDKLKQEIKEISIEFGVREAKKKKERKEDLIKRLEIMEKEDLTKQELAREYDEVKLELIKLEQYRINGLLLRSNIKVLENCSTASPFLTAMNDKKKMTTAIPSLKDANGISHENPHEVLQIASDFYSSLYQASPTNENTTSSRTSLLQQETLTLSEKNKMELDSPLDLEIIQYVILKKLKKRKSPGLDGLTSEFYQHFADEISPILLKIFQSSENELPESHYDGLITLIYKKGDPENIANYRPISLLNVDYKIFTLILTLRLQNVLGSILHDSQKQAPNRYILENTRSILDLIYLFENTKEKGSLVFLDQEKAFDRISWDYLIQVLKRKNFGPNFIHWIQLTMVKPRSRIKINNFLSPWVHLQQGVRQGDPLSPLLYVIGIDLFTSAIHNDPFFQGIQIPHSESFIKALLFADDTAVCIGTLEDFTRLIYWISIFSAASNSKINFQKSEGLLFRMKPPDSALFPINWVEEEPIRYLGIYLGKNRNEQKIWEDFLPKLRATFTHWGKYHFPFPTKIIIARSYVIPKINYMLSTLTLPKKVEMVIDKMIHDYLWNKQRSGRISRTTLRSSKEDGGINLLFSGDIAHNLHIRWIHRLLNNPNSTWTKLATSFLSNLFEEWGLRENWIIGHPPKTANLCPTFWISVLEKWNRLPDKCYETLSLSSNEALRLPIWANTVIKEGNSPISHPSWMPLPAHQIIRVGDLWFSDHWATPREIKETYRIYLTQEDINFLVDAIREAGIYISTDEVEEELGYDLPIPNKFNISKIKLEGMEIGSFKSLTKVKINPPTKYQHQWSSETGHTFVWKRIWKNAWHAPVANNINSTYYFFLQRALPTGDYMFKRGMIDPPRCECGHFETLTHVFWECKTPKRLWKEVETFWNRTNPSKKISISLNSIIYGSFPTLKHSLLEIFTILHRITLHKIWISRCQRIYTHTTVPIHLDQIKHLLKNNILTIFYSKKKRRILTTPTPFFNFADEKIKFLF